MGRTFLSPPIGSPLTASDLAKHHRFGIESDVLECAARRVTDRQAREDCGLTFRANDLSGIVYPRIDPWIGRIVGYRVRRDHPDMRDGRPHNKYVSSPDRAHPYFPPGTVAATLGDSTVPIVLSEAETSALAITCAARREKRSLVAPALGGCWGWWGRRGKATAADGVRVDERGELSDWDRIVWHDRRVYLALDSNVATNGSVQAARRQMVEALRRRGADVRLIEIPALESVNGPDDFIAARGDVAWWALVDGAARAGTREIRLTPASQIRVRPVRYLWADRIALGTLALIGGREGVGKTIFAYTIAGSITRGRLPGVYEGQPRAVIVAASEDSWEHTIVPRLMAAGADLELVYRVDVVTAEGSDGALSLPRDVTSLERAVAEKAAALVIFDPLMSRLDTALDTHKDAEVRVALEPIVASANASDACYLGLIHVNKSASNDPLTLLMGSRAFAAVARAVLFVMTDPDDEQRRLLGQPKNNLGRVDLPTLAFRVVGHCVAETDEGPVWTGKLEWLGESERSIREAVEDAAERTGTRSATSEAADWLQDYLQDQRGVVESSAAKAAGKAVGHSADALKRSLARLRITCEARGFPRRTYWLLPSQSAQPAGETSSTALTAPTGDFPKEIAHSQLEQVGAVGAAHKAPAHGAPTEPFRFDPSKAFLDERRSA